MKDKTKRRVPLGGPLERTDDDLERLARITPNDVEDAQMTYREHAPDGYKDMTQGS